MLSTPMLQKLNDQVRHEFYSSYAYLSMAAWFETQDLPGAAAWMRLQADEERLHATKFFDYILDRGAEVTLQGLAQPPVRFASALEVFEQALLHERAVTASINALYAQALEDKDFASVQFLDWFVKEQVEEEKNASQIIGQLKRIGNDGAALLQLDRALGQRQPEPAGGAEAD